LSQTLSYIGYDVTLAGNGLEASTLFLKGSYDLVIADLEMPVMNGGELCAFVKEQSPKKPVIVMTGFWDDPRAAKLTRCADAIIPKPFTLQQLVETVQRLLT
jgi:CheY-like chemotaxis protein